MSSRGWTIAAYLVVVVLMIGIELAARTRGDRWVRFGEVIRRAAGHRAAQIGLVLAWWWIGWHFFGG